jgi:hypothetical protein
MNREEMAIAYFKKPFQKLFGRTKENHQKSSVRKIGMRQNSNEHFPDYMSKLFLFKPACLV